MDKHDCVNIFLSEGAGLDVIVEEMKNNNENIKYDAFGHVRLDEINPGIWFGKYFKKSLNADKVLVQKSGYFARSSQPNNDDVDLINKTADKAFDCALNMTSCVVGLHQDTNNIECINVSEIQGGKAFDVNQDWFVKLLKSINQSI